MDAVKEKVVIVTGSTGGIGAGIATKFVEKGMRVVLVGRREDAGRAAAEKLGERATFVRCDVGVDADIDELARTTLDRFGRIDVLVNNAGLNGQLGRLVDIDLDRWDEVVRVNLRAPLAMTRAVAPTMIEQNSGSVINVASVSGKRAGYSGHDYSTAKAGLIHLTRSLAIELAEHRIRVNSISPGPIAAGMNDKEGTGEATGHPTKVPFADLLPENQPLDRPGLSGDIAEVALFLADEGSGFVTGQDIAVDGGMSAGRPWKVYQHDWEVIAASA